MMRSLFAVNNQLLAKAVLRTTLEPWKNVKLASCVNRKYTANTFKARESSLARNYDHSFQRWVLDFFKTNPNYSSFIVQHAKEDVPSCDLGRMDFDSLLNYFWTKKAQEALTPMLLRKIDAALTAKISSQTPASDLLKCLQIGMTSVPIQASKMESFRNSIIQLENRIKTSKLTPHDVVQTMYYASHLKNGVLVRRFQQAAVYHLDLSKMEKLSVVDLGIFCVSLFRSAVGVEKRAGILEFLEERFRCELDTLVSDHSAIFVSFVKCFRLSKHYKEDLLEFVASLGLPKLSELDVTARTHLGVWFAAAEYGRVEFILPFLSSCVSDMSTKISNRDAPRLKDFDNLLWSSASYGLTELNDVINRGDIADYVRDRLPLARNDPHLQISLLTWLWVCGCRLEKEVARYVTLETVRSIKDSKNFKSKANLYLLMTCAEIETPGLLKPNILNTRDYRLQPKVPQYLEKRPRLKELLAILQKQSGVLQLDNVRFAFQIPALYIGGIYAEHMGRPLCLEVLDSAVCLKNSRHLNGRMVLKLRLLEKVGLPVLKVEAPDAENIAKEERLEELKRDLFKRYSSLSPGKQAPD